MLCLVLSSLCSLQAYNYAEHLHNILLFCTTSPPTHFTRAPPSPAKNRYLNSRLMILHASELATELFEEVQSPRCTFATSIATAKAIRGRFFARVKALGWLKKKKLDFHHFQVRHFNNDFEQSWCRCRVGATVFRRAEFTTR